VAVDAAAGKTSDTDDSPITVMSNNNTRSKILSLIEMVFNGDD
jgi:hypothetical protein